MTDVPDAEGPRSRPGGLEDLTTADADAMDAALTLAPDLRIAAGVVARAASARLEFPMRAHEALAALLVPGTRVTIDGTRVSTAAIAACQGPDDPLLEDPIALAQTIVDAIERFRRHERGQSARPAGARTDDDVVPRRE